MTRGTSCHMSLKPYRMTFIVCPSRWAFFSAWIWVRCPALRKSSACCWKLFGPRDPFLSFLRGLFDGFRLAFLFRLRRGKGLLQELTKTNISNRSSASGWMLKLFGGHYVAKLGLRPNTNVIPRNLCQDRLQFTYNSLEKYNSLTIHFRSEL